MDNKIVMGLVAVLAVGVVGYVLMSGRGASDPMDVTDTVTTNTSMPAGTDPMETRTIVDVAVDAGSFSTLVTAVTEAGLVETLSGEGPFTVFAPTDEAFAKVPADTLQALLADKEALIKVLTYHVVAGRVMAADVVDMQSATTVQGQDLNITANEDGTVMINDATVLITDVEASNGVIHVIDTVLLPE